MVDDDTKLEANHEELSKASQKKLCSSLPAPQSKVKHTESCSVCGVCVVCVVGSIGQCLAWHKQLCYVRHAIPGRATSWLFSGLSPF